jgi:hypothetical protein
VRLVIARCSVDYDGRLTAHLPSALRLLIVKADGSVLVHSDGGSDKPLNWMSPPWRLTEPPAGDGQPGKWTVTNKAGETMSITIEETLSDTSVELGVDPGLVKEAQAEQALSGAKTEAERRRITAQLEVDELTRQKDNISSHLAQVRQLLGGQPGIQLPPTENGTAPRPAAANGEAKASDDDWWSE